MISVLPKPNRSFFKGAIAHKSKLISCSNFLSIVHEINEQISMAEPTRLPHQLTWRNLHQRNESSCYTDLLVQHMCDRCRHLEDNLQTDSDRRGTL